MRKLAVFNHVTLDGYFADASGEMSWAHNATEDPEFNSFVADNARGGGELLFGRVTYELMTRYWPTPAAHRNDPVVAAGINRMRKVVFSRTLNRADWNNTTVVKGELAAEVRKMKDDAGPDMCILGSGSIVAQLAAAGLIDEYQMMLNPLALGKGRTMFDGIKDRLTLKLTKTRAFANGNMFLSYEPAA